MVDLDQTIKLESRAVLGKGLGKLRHDGLVPAVIHNHGAESVHVMGNEIELGKIYQAAGKHHPLNLQVGSESYLALIKDAHFNPVKRRLQHLVFQAIRQDETVEAEVPLHFEGDFAAEKIGLEVQRHLDAVEIEALPKDLPDRIIIDASKLAELGDKIAVGDLDVPQGVTILTEPEQTIATVVEPKEQTIEEPETEAAEGEEGAEGGAAEGQTAEGTEGPATEETKE